MSIKKYFEVAENIQSLSNKSAHDVASQVESAGYQEQDLIKEERFIPRVNFSKPENFARYGSAEEYYAQSLIRIYQGYPYDGSLREKAEWHNESVYIDLHIFDNEYPRTNGYVILSADGWGTQSGLSGGYGAPATPEYIFIKGGPNPNPNGEKPYSTQFTGSNYYEPTMNRASNFSFNLGSKGAAVEFWLKKDEFITSLSPREVIFDLWNGEASSSVEYGRLRLELNGNTAATAVDALDTTGVKAAGVDSAFSFTIPASAGGEGGATTIRLSAGQSTAPPVAGAGSSIGIGFSDKTDAELAALIINAINAVATTNIVFAVSNNGMSGYDSGITAAQGSSDTQITLTMKAGGTGGNLTTALAYTSLGTDIVDVTDFTGGTSPVLLTAYSGTTGFTDQSVAASTFTTASLADGAWHHYAITLTSSATGVVSKFYVDGTLNNHTTLGSAKINDVPSTALRAHIGALVTSVSGSRNYSSTTAAGDGKLSASLDEFRYWKATRTSEEIGRFWFTQVAGGVNTDPTPFTTTEESSNIDLGVYFKFNEGITGRKSTDSTVLDYSGRFSNGAWTGYTTNSRNTGSAIVSSSAAVREFLDPIIYSFHPDVETLSTRLQLSGSTHDVMNNASIYASIPSWITEEDIEGSKDVKYLTQIISSYFDTLHLQIESLNNLKDIRYLSGSSEKPLPFAEKLLSTYGFVAPDLFLDAGVLEKLLDRSEDKVYEKSLHDIKNIIYQNIYNNLNYIYKSKGTEKAFRNLIRCFGIDDELVKVNMYGNNVTYELLNNRRNVIVADRFVNFNTPDNSNATVYGFADPTNANSVGLITSSVALTGGYATTLEAEVLFPLKHSKESPAYVNTNVISSSLFGIHGGIDSETETTWLSLDAPNFQVYAVRDELESKNVQFVLTGTAGGYVPRLTSSLYQNVYSNSRWNLSVRIKPENYPLKGLITSDNTNYTVELHGVEADSGEILTEFTVSGSVTTPPAGFLTGSKRAYVGAHRTNFTGSTLRERSDVKVNACRYWLDYLDDEVLAGHALDTENNGTLNPHFYAFGFNPSASFGDVTKFDTLVFNWEFLTNTGSDAAGTFTVADISSGSSTLTRFGTLGNILNKQYTAKGEFFRVSSVTAIDKDYVVSSKLSLPEGTLTSDNMIRVFEGQEKELFVPEQRPTQYYFAFEKSMYQVISEEMINYFANMKDFHNLLGAPVEKYRPEYKKLGFVKERFFDKVRNDEMDFERFYEFYKWFDSSLSLMLAQLVPASADVATNVRTIIENHVLERPKYQNKYPFLQKKGGTDLTASFDGNHGDTTVQDPSLDSGFFTNTSLTKRQIGSSNSPQIRPWEHFHAAVPSYTYDYYNSKYLALTNDPSPVSVGYDVAIDSSWTSINTFTWSGWLKFDPADGERTWFQFGDTGHRRAALLSTGEIQFKVGFSTPGTWTTTDASLSGDAWRHIAIVYDGTSTSNVPVIYVDGDSKTVTTNTAPVGTIDTPDSGALIGGALALGASLNNTFRDGEIATMSFWGAALSSAEVVEIYNKGDGYNIGPQNLTTHSAYSDLISWWRMGNDDDDVVATIYDQEGSNDATGNWGATTGGFAALSAMTAADQLEIGGGTYTLVKNVNMYWHRYMQERDTTGRTSILDAIKQSFNRRVGSPVKFTTEAVLSVGGVQRHPNNRPNYAFQATQPYGPVVSGTNIPTNIMMAFQDDVEQLLATPDVYYPSFKQRLGFGLDPAINVDSSGSTAKADGNLYAPFSLYSSSVKTGYNTLVMAQYKSGTMVTNLHNDFVADHDVPMQGPFAEKFVGGRHYRHTEINAGSDTRESRAEGFRLALGAHPSLSPYTGALAVVPPNYPFVDTAYGTVPFGWIPALPTAQRFRDETAKRPVNIKNILMTTASVGTRLSGTITHNPIGNYQKNYQVISTAGRTLNDPFFQDQSFDFALNPQNPFSRLPSVDRHPVQNVRAKNNTAAVFDDGPYDNYYFAATSDLNTNKQETWSFWINVTEIGYTNYFMRLSSYRYAYFDSLNRIVFRAYTTGATDGEWYTDVAVPPGVTTGNEWIHVVISYDWSSAANDAVIYVNGVAQTITENSTPDSPGLDYSGNIYIGRSGNSTTLTGMISDLAYYNKVLRADEVEAIYGNATLDLINHGPPRVASNLIHWWRMGDGTGDSASTIIDQMGNTNLTAAGSPTLTNISEDSCLVTANNNNFALPNRTGANSNQTVIVNRFSSPGDYKTLSRGYLDPAHEELSVYNAGPYRNREVIDYGLTGSASIDNSITDTIHVVDQLSKPRGLNQLDALHCGPYGIDAAYGSITAKNTRVDGGLGYSVTPSWNKVNRNPYTVLKEIPTGVGEFNNTASSYAEHVVYIGWGGYYLNTQRSAWRAAGVTAMYPNFTDSEGRVVNAHVQFVPFSVGAWVYARTAGQENNGRFWSGGADSTAANPSWHVGITSSAAGNFFTCGIGQNNSPAIGPAYSVTSSAIELNKWYHVLLTRACTQHNIPAGILGTGAYNVGYCRAGDVNLYVNGVVDNNTVNGKANYMGAEGKQMLIGGFRSNNTHATTGEWGWDGYITDFTIWRGALTANNATQLYNNGVIADIYDESLRSPTNPLPTKDLMGYYRFSPALGDTSTTVVNRTRAQFSGSHQTNGTASYYQPIGVTASTLLRAPTTVVQSKVYDNLNVQHRLPRSMQQYSWVTASIKPGFRIYDHSRISCFSASAVPELSTGSSAPLVGELGYGNINRIQTFPIDMTNHVLGTQNTGSMLATSGYFPSSSSGIYGYTAGIVQIGDNVKWNSMIGGNTTTGNQKAFAVGFWIKNESGSTTGTSKTGLVAFGTHGTGMRSIQWDNSQASGPRIFFRISRLYLGPGTDGQVYAGGSGMLSSGSWNHVWCTYDGTDPGGDAPATILAMRIWINGVKQTSGYAGALDTVGDIASNISIGGLDHNSYIGGGDSVDYIRDVVIYGPAEQAIPYNDNMLKALYNTGSAVDYSRATGSQNLYAWYPLDSSVNGGRGGSTYNNIKNWSPMTKVASPVAYGSNTLDSIASGTTAFGFQHDAPPSWETSRAQNKLHRLNNRRSGPYGYSSWQQIRTGEHPIARKLRETNMIGRTLVPINPPNSYDDPDNPYQDPRGDNFVDYFEAPIEDSKYPIVFHTADNSAESDIANNLIITVPYGNRIEYFSNGGLNNALGLDRRARDRSEQAIKLGPYRQIVNFIEQNPELSTVIQYREKIYPAQVNTYNKEVRGRTKFIINNIWSDDRSQRSLNFYGVNYTGSQGQHIARDFYQSSGRYVYLTQPASIWPMDPHLNYTLTSSVTGADGSGELMNTYSRYETHTASVPALGASGYTASTAIVAAPTYALRVPAGTSTAGQMVLAGDTEWVAPNRRTSSVEPRDGTISGKVPYTNYETYADRIRRSGKNYSILPEFRISELMETYVGQNHSQFLSPYDNIFSLTGGVPNSSAESTFYRTYSNSDFLKHFGNIDNDLQNLRSGNAEITRDNVKLECKAMIKFLPYKGFYPAERVLELARIFSQSFGDDLWTTAAGWEDVDGGFHHAQRAATWRIVLDPIMSPGILFNTIKSGLAVSAPFIGAGSNIAAVAEGLPDMRDSADIRVSGPCTGSMLTPAAYPEGNLYYGTKHSNAKVWQFGSGSGDSQGYMLKKLPFEALYAPLRYLNRNFISAGGSPSIFPSGSVIYDSGLSGTVSYLKNSRNTDAAAIPGMRQPYALLDPIQTLKDAQGGRGTLGSNGLYELAMDNFLCAVSDIFVKPMTNFQSAEEGFFNSVTQNDVYTMDLVITKDTGGFTMYNRASAFTFPVGANLRRTSSTSDRPEPISEIAFSHGTPPYFDGSARVRFTFTAPYTGQPTVDQILAHTTISATRDELYVNQNASYGSNTDNTGITGTQEDLDPRVQLYDSFNLFEKVLSVPPGTNTQVKRWMIQSKFETPILNFGSTPVGSATLASAVATSATSSADEIITRGMWHQYGAIPTGSTPGVSVKLEHPTDKTNSLARLCGFQPGAQGKNVGELRERFNFEEAVVAVPFETVDGQRQFIERPVGDSAGPPQDAARVALDKYVFPPRFDSNRDSTVRPILMYIFEFSATLSSTDLRDIWQNLPPSIGEKFVSQTATIEEKTYKDLILNAANPIRWMVFKVKKRAPIDFERHRRAQVEADTGLFPATVGDWSYNWPYDYFSLVELAKIDEEVTYASRDIQT